MLRRGGILAAVLVVVGLLVPLLGGPRSLPRQATPAACVAGAQVSTSADSFVAVPGSAPDVEGALYDYDSTAGATLGSIPVGYQPIAIAVDTTYDQVYVLNAGDPQDLQDYPPSVSVLSYSGGLSEIESPLSLPSGDHPSAIGVSPGGNHVIVADGTTGELGVIDPQASPPAFVGGTIGLPGPVADLAFSQNVGGVWAVYAGDTTNHDIYLLTLASSSVAPYYSYQSTDPGLDPTSMLAAGMTLYVGDANAHVIDRYATDVNDGQATLTAEGPPSWSVPSSNPPDDLAVTPDGATLYVASGTTSFLEIDTKGGAETNKAVPGGTGNAAAAMAVNADGTVLELAETNEKAVARWGVQEDQPQNALGGLPQIPSAVASVPAATLRFYAYVTQSASINSDGTGDVSVIDLSAGQDIADLKVGVDPEAVLPSADGSQVYVANDNGSTTGSVSVITTKDINTPNQGSAVSKILLPTGAWPDALALNPAGHELLVADFHQGEVDDVELNNGDAVATIPLDHTGPNDYEPVAIAMTPNGEYAYVTNFNTDSISILHSSGSSGVFTLQQTQARSALNLTTPYGAAVSPNGRILYVADYGSTTGLLHQYAISATDGSLSEIGSPVQLGSEPQEVTVAPTGSPIYVSVTGSNEVAVVNANPFALSTTTNAGPLPHGIATTPDGAEYVEANDNTCNKQGSFYIYSAGSTSPSAEVTFPNLAGGDSNPFGVAVSPAFSAPATVQTIPQGELSGGGVNPAEVATRTGLNDVQAGVDTATGAYSITLPGLKAASPRLPLDLAPSYDSLNDGQNGASPNPDANIGYGWTLPYAMTLQIPTAGSFPLGNDCEYTVTQENAALAGFIDVEGSNPCGDPLSYFGTPARVQGSLSEDANCPIGSGSCFVFERAGDLRFFFSTALQAGPSNNPSFYPLIGEEDAYGNTVTLAYGGAGSCAGQPDELSSVTAKGAGDTGTRALSFTWACPTGGPDQIASVTDPLGRTASFTYDDPAGDLGLYTLSSPKDRVASHTYEFSYDGAHHLSHWWDPDYSDAASYPTTPAATDGTAVTYTPFHPPACSMTVEGATQVVAPKMDGAGQTGGDTYTPTTSISYGAYAFCSGTGTVTVDDPDQNVTMPPIPSYSGETILETYVNRALMASTAGYGVLEKPAADDNADGHPDASSATTIYVRDPETLAAREVVDPDGNITSTEWNALGDPVSVTDPNGGTRSYLYNPDNELSESVDPLGRTTTYTYSEPRLTAITDPAGNVTKYLQAADGQTCEVLKPDAAPTYQLPSSCGSAGSNPGLTTTTFDAYGDVTSVTDPDGTTGPPTTPGHVTSYAYDLDGELCGSLSPNGYVADGHVTLSSCPSASGGPYLTVYPLYDALGDVLQKVTPAQQDQSDGNLWNTYYDAAGRKVAETTPLDTTCDGNDPSTQCTHATYYGYDRDGDLTSVTNGYGNAAGPSETTYTYDADGNRLSAVSPDGNAQGADPNSYRTVSSYDDLGRLLATQSPLGSTTCNPQQTSHCAYVTYEAHDPAGRVVTTTTPATSAHPDGTTTITTYDGDGNLLDVSVVDETSPGNPISDTKSSYYADDQLETTVQPDGVALGEQSQWTTTDYYDADGRLSKVVAPPGEGNTSGQGAGWGTTWYFYDAVGNRVAVTNGDGDGDTCDAATTQGCAATTYYTYDLAERLTSVQAAAGQASATTTSYADDADGNPQTVSDQSGVTTTYTHDSADELENVAYSDATPSVSYTYNPDGTRASMSASGTGAYDFAYAYDNSQRLLSVTNGGATVAGYAYDASGNVTSLSCPSGLVVSYGYTADDELRTASWGSGDTLSFSYDKDRTLSTTTAVAGTGAPTITTSDTYDGGQRLEGISTTSTAQSSPLLVTNYYDSGNAGLSIDQNGNPRVEEVSTNGVAQPNLYYAVDDVNRVNYQSTTQPSQVPVSASGQTYTYDKANFVTQGSAVAVQQYYGDGEIEQATTTGVNPAPVSFSYDPEQDRTGEQTPTSTTSYAFDGASELCWSAPTASLPPAGATSDCSSPPVGASTYTYDGDGLRRSETTSSGTQTFAWDTVTGVPRLLEDGQNDYVYGPGGTPLAQVALGTGVVDFLVSDREGSVRDVVSGTTGLSLAYTDYDVYGNPTASGGLGAFMPFGFQGGYTDPSGVVYFEHRYYDPGSGQFLSIDPLNQGTNSEYTFVNDNPLVGSDPAGTLRCGGGPECGGYGGSGSGPPPPAPQSPPPASHQIVLVDEVSDLGGGSNPQVIEGAPAIAFGDSGSAANLNYEPGMWSPGPDGRLWMFDEATGKWVSIAAPSATQAELIDEGEAALHRFVYRGIAKGENPSQGFVARSPTAGNSAISHVSGQIESQWISTTWSREIAEQRFGQYGVAQIDLSQVPSDIVDISNGIQGYPGNYRLPRWAVYNQEVLIRGWIPPEAVVNFFPPGTP
jgi:RHS repeat-associated protein